MYIYVYKYKCMFICIIYMFILYIYIYTYTYVCVYIYILISVFVPNNVAADYLICCELQLFTLSGKEGNNFFPSFFMGELNM